MAKIRDLGINAIPGRKSQNAFDGLQAMADQCQDHTCHEHTCEASNEPCEDCTDPTGCGGGTPPPPEKKKKEALTRDAVAQLQYQLQQKMTAATSLTN